ncbi:hypothetical protein HaLaN_06938, partial [Haematococcus lacustris]
MALLLGVPELVLAEDIKHPKVSEPVAAAA